VLIRRKVTPAMAAANRSNARRSTGPRTARGRSLSRLNGVRNGRRSAIAQRYFRLWFAAHTRGPWLPPIDATNLPYPLLCPAGSLTDLRREFREYLASVTQFVPAESLRKRMKARNSSKNHFFDERSRQEIENKAKVLEQSRNQSPIDGASRAFGG
jgi:hypothetical protein